MGRGSTEQNLEKWFASSPDEPQPLLKQLLWPFSVSYLEQEVSRQQEGQESYWEG